MATQDFRLGDHTSAARLAASGQAIVRMDRTIDTAVDGITAANIAQLFHIPAGCTVLDAGVDVETLEGGTLTVHLGPYTHSTGTVIDADGFCASINGNSALGVTHGTVGILMTDSDLASGSRVGYCNDVATDICAVFNNTADKFKGRFFAHVLNPLA